MPEDQRLARLVPAGMGQALLGRNIKGSGVGRKTQCLSWGIGTVRTPGAQGKGRQTSWLTAFLSRETSSSSKLLAWAQKDWRPISYLALISPSLPDRLPRASSHGLVFEAGRWPAWW